MKIQCKSCVFITLDLTFVYRPFDLSDTWEFFTHWPCNRFDATWSTRVKERGMYYMIIIQVQHIKFVFFTLPICIKFLDKLRVTCPLGRPSCGWWWHLVATVRRRCAAPILDNTWIAILNRARLLNLQSADEIHMLLLRWHQNLLLFWTWSNDCRRIFRNIRNNLPHQ